MRAVHIEVVHSLDTDSFLNAVMRFSAAEESQQNLDPIM